MSLHDGLRPSLLVLVLLSFYLSSFIYQLKRICSSRSFTVKLHQLDVCLFFLFYPISLFSFHERAWCACSRYCWPGRHASFPRLYTLILDIINIYGHHTDKDPITIWIYRLAHIAHQIGFPMRKPTWTWVSRLSDDQCNQYHKSAWKKTLWRPEPFLCSWWCTFVKICALYIAIIIIYTENQTSRRHSAQRVSASKNKLYNLIFKNE